MSPCVITDRSRFAQQSLLNFMWNTMDESSIREITSEQTLLSQPDGSSNYSQGVLYWA